MMYGKYAIALLALVGSVFAQPALTADQISALKNAHNVLRGDPTTMGYPAPEQTLAPLTWDPNIANDAQNWASQCNWQYSNNWASTTYGENIFGIYYTSGGYPALDSNTITMAVKTYWASSGKSFDFDTNECSSGACSPFTQMFSDQATVFGCGYANCMYNGNYQTNLFCDYASFAQYSGVAPYQVAPPSTPAPATPAPATPAPATPAPATPAPATPAPATPAPATPAPSTPSPSTPAPTPSSTPAPSGQYYSIDYRGSAMVTSIKDQGQCGSCWAFSSTAVSEAAFGKAHGSTTDLSDQFTLDCSGGGSCSGGWPPNALKGIVKEGGIPAIGSYTAYSGAQGTCSYSASQSYGSLASTAQTSGGTFQEIWTALATHGPVGIAVYADNSWYSYTGGVLSSAQSSINHAVTLVGYNQPGNYWIVKNQWGSSWGLSGYVYIDATPATSYGIQNYGAWWAIAN